MEWNVFCESRQGSNSQIEQFNIFNHCWFADSCARIAEKYKDDKERFAEEIKHELMYYFWSKCEWEILLSAWIGSDRVPSLKIDVYDQVNLNFPQFIEYLWANKEELKQYKLNK